MTSVRLVCLIPFAYALCACAHVPETFYGTTEPFAAEAVYFVLTDRFVNGDPSNDYRDQGGEHRTFDLPLSGPNGETDNIGYLCGNIRLQGDEAVFYRVFQHEGTNQTALVMLNEGERERSITVSEYLQPGTWRDAFSGESVAVKEILTLDVPGKDWELRTEMDARDRAFCRSAIRYPLSPFVLTVIST